LGVKDPAEIMTIWRMFKYPKEVFSVRGQNLLPTFQNRRTNRTVVHENYEFEGGHDRTHSVPLRDLRRDDVRAVRGVHNHRRKGALM